MHLKLKEDILVTQSDNQRSIEMISDVLQM